MFKHIFSLFFLPILALHIFSIFRPISDRYRHQIHMKFIILILSMNFKLKKNCRINTWRFLIIFLRYQIAECDSSTLLLSTRFHQWIGKNVKHCISFVFDTQIIIVTASLKFLIKNCLGFKTSWSQQRAPFTCLFQLFL